MKRFSWQLLAVLALSAAGMLFAGCVVDRSQSASSDQPIVQAAPPIESVTGTDSAPVAGIDAGTRPVAPARSDAVAADSGNGAVHRPAQDPLGREEDWRVNEEMREQAFRWYMERGRNLFQDGRYESARAMFAEAVHIRPNDADARRSLAEAESLVSGGGPGRGAGVIRETNAAVEAEQARRQEGLVELRRRLEDGRRAYEDQNYEEAIRILTSGLDMARWFRGRLDTSGEEAAMRSLIEQAKQDRGAKMQADLAYQTELVQQMAELEKRNRIQRWQEEIELLYEQAKSQFDREQYEECEITLAKILWKDPYNEDVIRLKEYCRNLRYQKENAAIKERMSTMWNRTLSDITESTIPFTESLFIAELPSFERWREIELRARQVIARQTSPEDPQVTAIKNELQVQTVSLSYTETPLPEILRNIQADTNINFILSRDVADMDDDELEVTIDVGSLKLASALKLLLDSLEDLTYYVESGVVWIATVDEAEGKGAVTRIFNVKDLLGGYKNFPGEQIQLSGGTQSGTGFGFGAVDDDDEDTQIEFEDLPDIIMESVSPDSWNGDTTNVDVGPAGTLIARNTPEILAEVADLLDDLRQSRGLMVTMEVRFIEVQDNFLEEVGIDFRGAGGIPPGAVGPNLTAAPLDDYQFGLNNTNISSRTYVLGRDTSTGIYWSNAPDSEIRSRVEHLFDQALGDPDILTSEGGAAFQFAFLDDIQISAILRAVKKRERVNLLTAPKVTCFNTQRANITIRNQVAYIEDFNVQAQQNVTIADPVVGTIEDGLVLDMRPVISADRRYVTVELQPTVALLKRPLDTITTTLGGVGSSPVTIQLPELEVQRVRTTVTVPDGGAFLIGGLRKSQEQRLYTGVPILSDLPIIGNLFERKGFSHLRSDLVVVVKCRITDLREMVNVQTPADLGDPGSANSLGFGN